MHRTDSAASLEGRHVVLFNWRDTQNPEGGGSERYVEAMARGPGRARRAGHDLLRGPRARAGDEVVDGVRYVRRGDHLGIYLLGILHLLLRRFGKVDLVVDVQNGLPFFTRLATRAPVVVLVHHVHREQWPVVFPGLLGRVGWWIERVLAPRLYRTFAVRRGVPGHPQRAHRPRRGARAHRGRPQRHRAASGPRRAAEHRPAPVRARSPGAAQAGRARRSTPSSPLRADHPEAHSWSSATAGGRSPSAPTSPSGGPMTPSRSPATSASRTSTTSWPGRG